MLTSEQLANLNQAIRQGNPGENQYIRVVKATEQAGLSFLEVLEHLLTQAVENAYQIDALPANEQRSAHA
jgi:hypothetical protein